MARTFKPDDTRPTCGGAPECFAANLRYEALPAAAIERVKLGTQPPPPSRVRALASSPAISMPREPRTSSRL